jgi:hypothetical protein
MEAPMTLLGRESMALIAAGRHTERMTADDKARIRRKLAQRLGSGIAAGAAVATHATIAQATHAALLSTLVTWLPIAAKLTVALAVSGAIGAVSVDAVMSRRGSTPAGKIAPVVTQANVPARREIGLQQALDNVATLAPDVMPNAVAEVKLPAKSPSETLPSHLTAPTDDALGRQVAAIRDARAALRRGDASSALAALDQLAVEGRDPLEQEALAARVSALCLKGDVNAARRVADHFILRFGDSLLVPQIRATCAFETDPPH